MEHNVKLHEIRLMLFGARSWARRWEEILQLHADAPSMSPEAAAGAVRRQPFHLLAQNLGDEQFGALVKEFVTMLEEEAWPDFSQQEQLVISHFLEQFVVYWARS